MQNFKIGDIVKRKESMWRGINNSKLEPFDRFQITAYFWDQAYPTVCLKESGQYQWDAGYFELVVEDKPKRFLPGDKVISIKNTLSTQEGHIGFVVDVPQNSYDYAVKDELWNIEYFNEDELELLSVKADLELHVRPTVYDTPKPTSALDKQVSGNHYKDCGIQPIEYIHANGLSYLEGNVIKYTTRHSKKNGKQDILKAIHYLELILEMEYKDESI